MLSASTVGCSLSTTRPLILPNLRGTSSIMFAASFPGALLDAAGRPMVSHPCIHAALMASVAGKSAAAVAPYTQFFTAVAFSS